MKQLLGFLMLLVATSCTAGTPKPDSWFRDRSIKLVSEQGSCSGEQVIAPSGKTYVLTAGHCLPLADSKRRITAITEDGKRYKLKVIAEDTRSDLLLLTGIPKLKGLEIARQLLPHQAVKTYTHGNGFDTYKTEGEIIQTQRVKVALSEINSDETLAQCRMPKHEVYGEVNPWTGQPRMACLLSVDETMMTAMIVPGSSGGMVVDLGGKLVGVVSAGDGHFGAIVTLKDIKRFLSRR